MESILDKYADLLDRIFKVDDASYDAVISFLLLEISEEEYLANNQTLKDVGIKIDVYFKDGRIMLKDQKDFLFVNTLRIMLRLAVCSVTGKSEDFTVSLVLNNKRDECVLGVKEKGLFSINTPPMASSKNKINMSKATSILMENLLFAKTERFYGIVSEAISEDGIDYLILLRSFLNEINKTSFKNTVNNIRFKKNDEAYVFNGKRSYMFLSFSIKEETIILSTSVQKVLFDKTSETFYAENIPA